MKKVLKYSFDEGVMYVHNGEHWGMTDSYRQVSNIRRALIGH